MLGIQIAEVIAFHFSILDDVEIYEYEKPFTLKDLASLSGFLNQLVFRLIWDVPRLLGTFAAIQYIFKMMSSN